MKLIFSKSGNTACQIEFTERANCTYWRLEALEWHYIGQSSLAYEKKWVIKEMVRTCIEKIDRAKIDTLESPFSISAELL